VKEGGRKRSLLILVSTRDPNQIRAAVVGLEKSIRAWGVEGFFIPEAFQSPKEATRARAI
jgi:hypothetical protein